MVLAFNPITNEEHRIKLLADLKQFSEDVRHIQKNREELLQNHPDEWVIVYNGKLIGHGPSLTELLETAEAEGIPRACVAKEFLEKNPPAMALRQAQ